MRRAFTLVELLIVITLILILAGIAVYFFPNAASAAREARAAQSLQGWLNIAKQRAMRDQRPYGVRLIFTTVNVGNTALNPVVMECSFIEQPDDVAGGTGNVAFSDFPIWNAGTNYPAFTNVLFQGAPYYNNVPSSGQSPPTFPNIWIPGQYAPWSATNNYPPLTNVVFNGVVYYNRVPSFGQNPAITPGVWHANSSIVTFTTADLLGGQPLTVNPLGLIPPSNNLDGNAKYWTVQPGDRFEVNGGLPKKIEVMLGTNRVAVTPALTYPLIVSASYKINRMPRIAGDETLKLPEGTLIDLTTNAKYNKSLPAPARYDLVAGKATFADVLFSPSGQVISPGVSDANIHLWVRAPDQDPANATNEFRGDPTIVSVFVRTGFVGAYGVDPNTVGNPYTLVR